MSAIKTGISIREDLAREADELAAELGLTRSQLFSLAVSELLERRESCRITERLDEAYGDGLEDDERELLDRSRDYHRDRLGGEWRPARD